MFSVVIPAYKAEATIKRAIDSVIMQTLPAGEIIVVSDDGVDYRTLTTHPISHVFTGQNGSGEGSARNAGIAVAKHSVIALLDADDAYAPEHLENMAPLVQRYGAAMSAMNIRDDATGNVLESINASFAHEGLSADELSVAGLHGFGNLVFDISRCGARYDVHRHLADIVFAMSLYDDLEKVGYHASPTYQYYRRQDSLCNEEGSGEMFLKTITQLLDAAHPIAAYKAYGALRKHLLCIEEAERHWLALPVPRPEFKSIHAVFAQQQLM